MRLSHAGGDPPTGRGTAGARESRPRATPDHGYVTAETAVALPSLFLVALMLVWVLSLVTAQMQCVDAARAGARVVSRGESFAASEAAALAAAPDGAAVSISRSGEFVRVEVSVSVKPAGGLVDMLPAVRVNGVAHAIAEDAVGFSGLALLGSTGSSDQTSRRSAGSPDAILAVGSGATHAPRGGWP